MNAHPDLAIADIANKFDAMHWQVLDKAHLTAEDLTTVVRPLSAHQEIATTLLGHSYEGTPIIRYSLGSGPLTILAWTQMHGDEPTATAAVLDWLHILLNSEPVGLPKNWQDLVTVHVIPMLNPDGAARKTRVNAQGIDINRDAKALQSPEGRILDQQVKQLAPDVAFNLHDQNPYYTAGTSTNPATIAFLAPAYHEDKHVNASRLRAKQLIAGMAGTLNYFIPNSIGRYDDTYSFRSFGDNIAASGASTILIESGAAFDDPHRQLARKMNVIALQYGLLSLLTDTYRAYSLADYYRIPDNREDGLCDTKLSHITLGLNPSYHVDISINISAKTGKSNITAIGDLRTVHGFSDIDGRGLTLADIKPYVVTSPLQLDDLAYRKLLAQGVSYFVDANGLLTHTCQLPIRVETAPLPQVFMLPGERAFFLLKNDNGVQAAVLEGKWITLNP
ncbi:M14 family zinc carboxypeptidase [Alteromonas sp. C1M14]|uniref:M14 family zinc carboxypeptidase n=1 Tax=Alteromonas sp. C1M14 TaxID=2841567 RepID=UPI001C09AB0B|nr:M14 family zinc carboxypeptidase [Alteromonas sp. C1M14]MBU2978713.1 peptidase M14 [Alteromonas sp. C1M14]